MNKLGIKCILVIGKGYDSDVGHMWNQVYLEKDWYNMDVTWDITTKHEKIISFDHFMVSDKKNELTHHSADSPHQCTSNRFDYYFYYDLIVNTDDEARSLLKKEISKGKTLLFLEFGNKDKVDRSQKLMGMALSEVSKGKHFKRVKASITYDLRMQTYHIMIT